MIPEPHAIELGILLSLALFMGLQTALIILRPLLVAIVALVLTLLGTNASYSASSTRKIARDLEPFEGVDDAPITSSILRDPPSIRKKMQISQSDSRNLELTQK